MRTEPSLPLSPQTAPFAKELAVLEIADPPVVVGQHSGKNLVIAGAARCLWDDLYPYRQVDWGNGWDLMVINEAGLQIPLHVHHWTGLHPEYFNDYRHIREHYARFHGHEEDYKFHACRQVPGVDIFWQSQKLGGGSSAWNAAVYGVLMGYQKIILCGAPLDDSGHFFDPPWPGMKVYEYRNCHDTYTRIWQWGQEKIFKGRVKSRSGLTKEICGAPF